ncbi:MAG TPA: ethylbenzene dehydrogenase-related protein [Anaeromyxobacteraceae bacterium]|nr:ethylbenzene dehydrogenase-related protein [Anaeromyxobacteraceae bacterium]
MRALLAAVLLLPAALPARAGDFLSTQTLEVARVAGPVPSDPADAAWDALPVLPVAAAPQHTIRLNDRRANAALDGAGNRTVRVRAATDGKDLAVWLAWDDATESRPGAGEVDAYGDAVALQFPARFGAGTRLPYVGMGDEAQEVLLYLARAGSTGESTRQAVARGFGSSARADLGGLRATLRYDPVRKGWRAVLVRPVKAGGSDLSRPLVPFSVAVWDGAGSERGGNKALAGWKFLRMPGAPAEPAFEAEVAWGHRPGDLGDPAKGRELFQGACSACHSVGADRAVPGLAPDLTTIGVIATPAYLRESLLAPSAVIVPNPNPAQHQDRSGKPDARGAWPPDEAYVWYTIGADGRKSSAMPDYATMPADEIAAIVAWLSTLGAGQPTGGKTP